MLVLEFIFDKSNPNWVDGNNTYNFTLLLACEEYMNHKYELKGRVTLDEILNYLEIPIPPGLEFYGWDKEFYGDKHIEFGIRDQMKPDQKIDCIFLRFNIPMDNKTRKEVTS